MDAKGATGWVLEVRHPVAGGDASSLCFAGDVLAAGSNLRAEAITRRRSAAGFVTEPPLAGAAPPTLVLCDGNRIAVVPRTPNVSPTERSLKLYSPVGNGWSMNELPLGAGSTTGVAMSKGALFVGVSDARPRVRPMRERPPRLRPTGEMRQLTTTTAPAFTVTVPLAVHGLSVHVVTGFSV